jgi:hypothetical protein
MMENVSFNHNPKNQTDPAFKPHIPLLRTIFFNFCCLSHGDEHEYGCPCCLVEVYRRFRDTSGLNRKAMGALMLEAGSTSQTSVNLYHATQRNNPEDSHF